MVEEIIEDECWNDTDDSSDQEEEFLANVIRNDTKITGKGSPTLKVVIEVLKYQASLIQAVKFR